jgi:6,7-dimethyl-8-ribityllumazine synthase
VLKKIAPRKERRGGTIAIVAARYNPKFTDALVRFAKNELLAGGADRVEVVRVPGSFEIPVVASRLAQVSNPRFDVIICFGAILRGATTHAQNIADAVSFALGQLQIQTGVPIIHGVLLFEDEEQAKVRCLGGEHNRGVEAARTALEMIRVMETLSVFE